MTITLTEYQVTINFSGLGTSVGTAGGADGAIDPTTVTQYMTNTLHTGTSFGTVAVGQTVLINNYPVTLVTGTTAANVATDINNLSYKHHAVAGTSGGNLTLINQPLFAQRPVTVSDGTAGITAQLGFLAPTIATVAAPAQLTYSMAKSRGNWRWKQLLARLSQTMNIDHITNVVLSGTDTTFASNPTAIQFNIAIGGSVYNYDNNNNLITGLPAVQYACAYALMDAQDVIDVVYNPTNTTPTPPPTIVAGPGSYEIIVAPMTTVLSTALAAVTVTNVAD